MKTQQACVFPVIPPDLRREETICLMADALDYLETTLNTIMTRLNERVEQNRNKMKEINRRCSVAQAKIEKLKGNKKATKIFCSAKYPAGEEYTFYSSVYPLQSSLGEMTLPALPTRKIVSKHPNPDDRVMKEKLQFFDYHFNSQSKLTTEQGLGRLPRDSKFISSLLLFNTSENPYQKYVMSDPLRGISKTKKNLDNEDEDAMGSAPLSISQREQLDHQIGENYFYSPGLGEVPEIDVPLDLPDLPGIANDLAYNADIGPAIAPSLPLANYPALPEILPEVPSVSMIELTRPPEPVQHVPPPPPQLSLPSAPVSNMVNVSSVPSAPPPPPPPPPPVEEIPQDLGDVKPKEASKAVGGAPVAVTNPGDARANLLESIRQAGGKKKLRSVEDRKIEAKKKKEEAKVSSGPEFMEELFSKLLMRRRGISGTRGTESQPEAPASSGSAIEKFFVNEASSSPKTSISEECSEDDWD